MTVTQVLQANWLSLALYKLKLRANDRLISLITASESFQAAVPLGTAYILQSNCIPPLDLYTKVNRATSPPFFFPSAFCIYENEKVIWKCKTEILLRNCQIQLFTFLKITPSFQILVQKICKLCLYIFIYSHIHMKHVLKHMKHIWRFTHILNIAITLTLWTRSFITKVNL